MSARRLLVAGLAAAALAGLSAPAPGAAAEAPAVAERDWSFEGPFGTFERGAARRGLTVYRQVCSGCHSLDLVAFRHLRDIGFSADEVDALAAGYDIEDGPNDQGEMFTRPGRPADFFPPPYDNEQIARLANNGALPPDLSVMTKARAGGPDYLYAFLTGYADPPEGAELRPGMFWNTAFPGHQTAMPPPLVDGLVDYADGTEATVEQMAADVTTFLAWAAEPELEERKRMGVKVVLFLIVFAAMLYAVKREVWKRVD